MALCLPKQEGWRNGYRANGGRASDHVWNERLHLGGSGNSTQKCVPFEYQFAPTLGARDWIRFADGREGKSAKASRDALPHFWLALFGAGGLG